MPCFTLTKACKHKPSPWHTLDLMLKHVLLRITCLNLISYKNQKNISVHYNPRICETLAVIHAQCMFLSHKSTIVQTIMLTSLGLNAETFAINYCQKKNYILVPRSNKHQTTSQYVALRACHETFPLIYAAMHFNMMLSYFWFNSLNQPIVDHHRHIMHECGWIVDIPPTL